MLLCDAYLAARWLCTLAEGGYRGGGRRAVGWWLDDEGRRPGRSGSGLYVGGGAVLSP